MQMLRGETATCRYKISLSRADVVKSACWRSKSSTSEEIKVTLSIVVGRCAAGLSQTTADHQGLPSQMITDKVPQRKRVK